MKMYILAGLILAGVFGLLYFVVKPFILFFLIFASSLLTLIPTIIVVKILPSRFWPTIINIYEERYGGLSITKSSRAKRVTKKGKEYYSFIDGMKIPAMPKDCIISGSPNILNIFTPDGVSFFPMKPNTNLGNKKITIKVKDKDGKDIDKIVEVPEELKLLNQDQRLFLADQIVANKKITAPPLKTLEKILPLLAIIIPAIILIVAMLFLFRIGPEFVTSSLQMNTQANEDTRMTIDKWTDAMKSSTFYKEPPQPVTPPSNTTGKPPF